MNLHKTLYTIDKTTSIIDTETAVPSETEMMVKPLFVGVCGTDLQIIRRQRPDPATTLGHEGIGLVMKESNLVDTMPPGSCVVFNSVDPTDQNHILGHNTPGLLQQHYLVPERAVKNDLVVPFPATIDPLLGALVEPLSTVVYGHQLVSKATPQSCVVIVGAGAIGIMHALYARSQGYKRILLVNASKNRLDWCVQRGIIAQENALLDSDTLAEEILAATSGAGADAVYMCTSRPNALTALRRALQYVKPGGCIDLVGGIKDGDTLPELPAIPDLNAVRRANFCGIPADGYVEKTKTADDKHIYVTGHRGSSYQHVQQTIDLLSRHGDIFRMVISHVISFEAAVDLFNDIAKGPVTHLGGTPYIKAVIDMNQTGTHITNSNNQKLAV